MGVETAVGIAIALVSTAFQVTQAQKAKKKAGVLSQKKGFQWYWSLPAGEIPNE